MKQPYKSPSNIKQDAFQMKDFLGVDFTTHESEVNPKRSPDAKNVISGQMGSMDKRFGTSIVNYENFGFSESIWTMERISYVYERYLSGSGWDSVMEYVEGALFIDGEGKVKITNSMPLDGSPFPFSISQTLKQINVSTGLLTDFVYPIGTFKPKILKISQYLYMIIGEDFIPEKPTSYDGSTLSTYFIKILDKSGNSYYDQKPSDYGWVFDYYTYAYVLDAFNDTVTSKIGCKIPTTQIARTPDGKTSTSFEGRNLLTSNRINMFASDGTSTQYVLDGKCYSTPSVQKLNADGTWTFVTGVTYTYGSSTITLPSVIPVSPIVGQDNVKVLFSSDVNRYTANSFKNYGRYGFNGGSEFIFFIERFGNKLNRDWRMRVDDLYIDENGYTDFGSDETTILGYGLMGDEQIIYAKNNGGSPSIFIRSSSLDSVGELIFPVRTGVSGVGAVNGDTFASIRGDNIWLTEYGVSALITNDITNVQSVQDRGFYVNQLIKNNSYAFSIVFENKYYLFDGGNKCYVADARFKSSERLSPSESFQYDWTLLEFPFTVRCAMVIWNRLYLGTYKNGVVRLNNENDQYPYCDESLDIATLWTLGIDYAENKLVYDDLGKHYRCLKPHTSSIDRNVDNVFYWQEIMDYDMATIWDGNSVFYGLGKVVIYSGNYYKCLFAHTSTPSNYPTGIGVTIWKKLPGKEPYQIPVIAYWTTPIMNMGNITMRKTLKNLWVRLGKHPNMSVKIYYSTQGVVSEKYDGIFDFSNIDFSRFTFSTDTDPSVMVTNRQERKFMSIQFKVESRDQNPFSLLEIVGKYTINNVFKG